MVEATAVGPVQVVHRAIVERRTVAYRYVPAPKGGPTEEPPVVEPWTVSFDVPEAEDSWSAHRALDELQTAVQCACGAGTVERAFEVASGTGTGTSVHWTTETCSVCKGSARVFAIPEVEVEVSEELESRVLEREELPVDLLIEVGESFDDGERVYHEEAERLRPRSGGSGAYRAEAPRVSEEVSAVVDQLLKRADAMHRDEGRIHGESIEVLQVPIFRVSLAGGATGLLYRGKPWKAPPSQRGRRALRSILFGSAYLLVGVVLLSLFLLLSSHSK